MVRCQRPTVGTVCLQFVPPLYFFRFLFALNCSSLFLEGGAVVKASCFLRFSRLGPPRRPRSFAKLSQDPPQASTGFPKVSQKVCLIPILSVCFDVFFVKPLKIDEKPRVFSRGCGPRPSKHCVFSRVGKFNFVFFSRVFYVFVFKMSLLSCVFGDFPKCPRMLCLSFGSPSAKNSLVSRRSFHVGGPPWIAKIEKHERGSLGVSSCVFRLLPPQGWSFEAAPLAFSLCCFWLFFFRPRSPSFKDCLSTTKPQL